MSLFAGACLELYPEGTGTRLLWTTDLLPNELEPIARMMDAGTKAMKATLGDLAA